MSQHPPAMTQSDFAKARGVTKMAVSQWKKKGLLVFTDKGLVDVAKSTARIDSRPAVNKGGKANRVDRLPPMQDERRPPKRRSGLFRPERWSW
jgi:hypothetical protein